jgi:hypothetical protein
MVVDGVGQFDLDGKDASVVADGDKVDFVIAVARAEVPDGGFGGLGGHAHAQGGQRLSCVRDRVAFRGFDQTTLWGSG